ncbi:MAG: hypothetical protein H6732_07090 [Alphaproteobacteria bacterium]|nr:hypothetical protein [Alphaproteobacteria bacterium]
MTPPTLSPVPVELLPAFAADAVPPRAGPVRWFYVAESGVAAGLALQAGAVVMVGGRAHVGDSVVLVPALRGVPRLGTVARGGLVGDRGERCDEARWRVAGRILGVLAPQDVAPSSVRPRQLALFPARAA